MRTQTEKFRLLAIDPGNAYSAYVVLDECLNPQRHAKVENEDFIQRVIPELLASGISDLAIEMIASYGMAVGKSVFDTCVYIGRLKEACKSVKRQRYIYRMEEKVNLCHDSRAKDANIRVALVDRFAYGIPNGGKGTKKDPGFFYGFAADQWAAMAVGVTYYDMYIRGVRNEQKEL